MNGINFGYIFHVLMKCPILSLALGCFLFLPYLHTFDEGTDLPATPEGELLYAMTVDKADGSRSVLNGSIKSCKESVIECTEELFDYAILHTADGYASIVLWAQQQQILQTGFKMIDLAILDAADAYAATVLWLRGQPFIQAAYKYGRSIRAVLEAGDRELHHHDDKKEMRENHDNYPIKMNVIHVSPQEISPAKPDFLPTDTGLGAMNRYAIIGSWLRKQQPITQIAREYDKLFRAKLEESKRGSSRPVDTKAIREKSKDDPIKTNVPFADIPETNPAKEDPPLVVAQVASPEKIDTPSADTKKTGSTKADFLLDDSKGTGRTKVEVFLEALRRTNRPMTESLYADSEEEKK